MEINGWQLTRWLALQSDTNLILDGFHFETFAEAALFYEKDTFLTAYLEDGSKYGEIKDTKKQTVRGYRKLRSNYPKRVIQVDFKYYVINPLGYTIGDFNYLIYLLEKYFKTDKFDTHCKNSYSYNFNSLLSSEDYNLKNYFYECCLPAVHSRHLVKKQSISKLKNFDVKHFFNYSESFKESLSFEYEGKELQDLEDDVDELYKFNVRTIADFYMSTVDKIESGDFDFLAGTIKRLNARINEKSYRY